MVADARTKNLPAPAFEQHRAVMLGEDEALFTAIMCRVYSRTNYSVFWNFDFLFELSHIDFIRKLNFFKDHWDKKRAV